MLTPLWFISVFWSLRKLLQQGILEPEFYGDLVYGIKKIVGKSHFRNNSESLLTIIKEYDIIHMLCGRLHPSYLTQPRLIAMLHSLIARRRVGPQTQWRPRHKAFTSGLGLDAMSLACPTVVQLVVSFKSGLQWGISQEYCLFVSSRRSIWFCVFAEMHWVRKPLCEPNFLCIFCIKNYIGTKGEVCSVKGL